MLLCQVLIYHFDMQNGFNTRSGLLVFYMTFLITFNLFHSLGVDTSFQTLNSNVDFKEGKNNHHMAFYCQKAISIYLPFVAINQIRRCEIQMVIEKVSKWNGVNYVTKICHISAP